MATKNRIYTDESFDAFKRSSNGSIQCPPGDYTRVKRVPSDCVFKHLVTFRSGVDIGSYCRFYRSVYTGSNCIIHLNCLFMNTLGVENDCTLGSFTRVCGDFMPSRNCKIHSYCVFNGRFAPFGDVKVGDGVKVRFGKGRKVARLEAGQSVFRVAGIGSYVATSFAKTIGYPRYLVADAYTNFDLKPIQDWVVQIRHKSEHRYGRRAFEAMRQRWPDFDLVWEDE